MSNARNLANLLNSSGVLTADAGVKADNITIDGTEIDLSSGSLTLDAHTDIILDADSGVWRYKDDGTTLLQFAKDGASMKIFSAVSDADIIIQGNDGGSVVNALTLDMSDAGAATLNNGLTLTDGDINVASGHGINFAATSDASGQSSELLDDYEEGTFIPTATFATPPSGGGTAGYGQYTKIGRLVTIHLNVNNIDKSGASGDLQITGLPFTSTLDSGDGAVSAYQGTCRVNNVNIVSDSYLVAEITDGTANVRITEITDNTTNDIINTGNIADDSSDIYATISYTTAS